MSENIMKENTIVEKQEIMEGDNEPSENHKRHLKKRAIIIPAAIITVLLILFAVAAVYVNDYYPAGEAAMQLVYGEEAEETEPSATETDGVAIAVSENGRIVFRPQEIKAGLIFYPGGKVGYEAYAPLLEKIAEHGILCVLVKEPFNLAVLDINAADGIREEYPEVTDWYIGGHSLGGAIASAYVSRHIADYKGLVLLGAYSMKDLSKTDLKVLCVYGSEDGVLSRTKYEDSLKYLPSDYTEYVIEGGCHAYFGDYGAQKGDGNPTITREEQMEETVEQIVQMLLND